MAGYIFEILAQPKWRFLPFIEALKYAGKICEASKYPFNMMCFAYFPRIFEGLLGRA